MRALFFNLKSGREERGMSKKRILTGDRPTGKLHLGHYVGSLKNRIKRQEEFQCFLILYDQISFLFLGIDSCILRIS